VGESPCPVNCGLNGRCIGGFCKCKPGYWGVACSRTKAYAPEPGARGGVNGNDRGAPVCGGGPGGEEWGQELSELMGIGVGRGRSGGFYEGRPGMRVRTGSLREARDEDCGRD
jgi:hypothetical protein